MAAAFFSAAGTWTLVSGLDNREGITLRPETEAAQQPEANS